MRATTARAIASVSPATVDTVTTETEATIALDLAEPRAVTAYAAACAEPALPLFERERPDDPRPRAALEQARVFADGGARNKALRVTALDANRAGREAQDQGFAAAADAARACGAAAAAAYLHPLAKATQVLHILGSAAHAARALELDADTSAGAAHLEAARTLANPVVVRVLRRYPPAPSGRGRIGELARTLDALLRPAVE